MKRVRWSMGFGLACGLLATGCVADVSDGQEVESAEQSVINGTTTSGYPAVVMLRSRSAGFCTGTLISPSVVLTAAHCIDGGAPAFVGFGVNGSQNLVSVSRAVQHPRWNRNNLSAGNDIAVLVLASQVSGVTPIPVSQNVREAVGGDRATVVGYGNNSTRGTGFGTKREAPVNVLTPGGSDGVSESRFVKIGTSSGTQACNGDSGGPVFFNDSRGVQRVVGVTSYGYTGCTGGSFHTRVAAYTDFIDDYVDLGGGGGGGGGGTPDPDPDPGPGEDNTPPSLSLVAPTSSNQRSGSFSVTVAAGDNDALSDIVLEWYNNGTYDEFSCAAGEGACTQNGGNFTFMINVGTGTRYFRVHALDRSDNETTIGWYRLYFN